MYSGVRLVAQPLMEFPIFSFLRYLRSSLLGFTRFPFRADLTHSLSLSLSLRAGVCPLA